VAEIARGSGSRKERPGPGRPAGADSAQTRARAIEAAREFFAGHGYESATNKLIADAAGVTSGALYYHFGSKGELFAAVCDDSYETIYSRYAGEVTEPADIRGLLHQLLASSVRLNREQPSLAGFVAIAPLEARRHPELADAINRHVKRRTAVLADRIRAGQDAGLIRDGLDTERAASLVGLLLHGFADAAADVTPDELEAQVRLFEDLIDGGLGPETA
jgi:AcrR family transcriptional regulator